MRGGSGVSVRRTSRTKRPPSPVAGAAPGGAVSMEATVPPDPGLAFRDLPTELVWTILATQLDPRWQSVAERVCVLWRLVLLGGRRSRRVLPLRMSAVGEALLSSPALGPASCPSSFAAWALSQESIAGLSAASAVAMAAVATNRIDVLEWLEGQDPRTHGWPCLGGASALSCGAARLVRTWHPSGVPGSAGPCRPDDFPCGSESPALRRRLDGAHAAAGAIRAAAAYDGHDAHWDDVEEPEAYLAALLHSLAGGGRALHTKKRATESGFAFGAAWLLIRGVVRPTDVRRATAVVGNLPAIARLLRHGTPPNRLGEAGREVFEAAANHDRLTVLVWLRRTAFRLADERTDAPTDRHVSPSPGGCRRCSLWEEWCGPRPGRPGPCADATRRWIAAFAGGTCPGGMACGAFRSGAPAQDGIDPPRPSGESAPLRSPLPVTGGPGNARRNDGARPDRTDLKRQRARVPVDGLTPLATDSEDARPFDTRPFLADDGSTGESGAGRRTVWRAATRTGRGSVLERLAVTAGWGNVRPCRADGTDAGAKPIARGHREYDDDGEHPATTQRWSTTTREWGRKAKSPSADSRGGGGGMSHARQRHYAQDESLSDVVGDLSPGTTRWLRDRGLLARACMARWCLTSASPLLLAMCRTGEDGNAGDDQRKDECGDVGHRLMAAFTASEGLVRLGRLRAARCLLQLSLGRTVMRIGVGAGADDARMAWDMDEACMAALSLVVGPQTAGPTSGRTAAAPTFSADPEPAGTIAHRSKTTANATARGPSRATALTLVFVAVGFLALLFAWLATNSPEGV